MIENIKLFFNGILKIVKLPPQQQVIFLCLLIIFSVSVASIKLYRKTESNNYSIQLERNEYKSTIKQLELKLDSVYILRQQEKEEYLKKEITRMDSLLRESEKIKTSIKK